MLHNECNVMFGKVFKSRRRRIRYKKKRKYNLYERCVMYFNRIASNGNRKFKRNLNMLEAIHLDSTNYSLLGDVNNKYIEHIDRKRARGTNGLIFKCRNASIKRNRSMRVIKRSSTLLRKLISYTYGSFFSRYKKKQREYRMCKSYLHKKKVRYIVHCISCVVRTD